MRKTGLWKAVVVGAAVAGATGLFGCKKSENQAQAVKVDGSSTVFPIMEAIAEEYGRANRGVHVTVGISGTGGGFKKFCTGETDLSNASRPIKPSEVELCAKNGVEYVELPVAYDGLAVVVNPKNSWANEISVAELKAMFEPAAQGKISRWRQVREGWPDTELRLYGPGVDSGTYDYFTEAVVGQEHASRGDFTSSEDDNVIVTGIANDTNALGFFGFAYYAENKDKLKVLPVNGVVPSLETIRDGSYQPLSRPVFVYVSKASLEKPAVAALVKYLNTEGGELVKEVGYIPLPQRAYELSQARVDARRTGSLFGGKGSQVGVSIPALLEKEQQREPQKAEP